MQRPYKRTRLNGSSQQENGLIRQFDFTDSRFQSRLESIFQKYGRDFDGVGDEIDLESGEVVVNNGHIETMRFEEDAEGLHARQRLRGRRLTPKGGSSVNTMHRRIGSRNTQHPEDDSDGDSVCGDALDEPTGHVNEDKHSFISKADSENTEKLRKSRLPPTEDRPRQPQQLSDEHQSARRIGSKTSQIERRPVRKSGISLLSRKRTVGKPRDPQSRLHKDSVQLPQNALSSENYKSSGRDAFSGEKSLEAHRSFKNSHRSEQLGLPETESPSTVPTTRPSQSEEHYLRTEVPNSSQPSEPITEPPSSSKDRVSPKSLTLRQIASSPVSNSRKNSAKRAVETKAGGGTPERRIYKRTPRSNERKPSSFTSMFVDDSEDELGQLSP